MTFFLLIQTNKTSVGCLSIFPLRTPFSVNHFRNCVCQVPCVTVYYTVITIVTWHLVVQHCHLVSIIVGSCHPHCTSEPNFGRPLLHSSVICGKPHILPKFLVVHAGRSCIFFGRIVLYLYQVQHLPTTLCYDLTLIIGIVTRRLSIHTAHRITLEDIDISRWLSGSIWADSDVARWKTGDTCPIVRYL